MSRNITKFYRYVKHYSDILSKNFYILISIKVEFLKLLIDFVP